jgi:hypothetical protein
MVYEFIELCSSIPIMETMDPRIISEKIYPHCWIENHPEYGYI